MYWDNGLLSNKGFFTLALCFYFEGFFHSLFFLHQRTEGNNFFAGIWSFLGVMALFFFVQFFSITCWLTVVLERTLIHQVTFFCCSLFEGGDTEILSKMSCKWSLAISCEDEIQSFISYANWKKLLEKVLGVYAVNLVKNYSNVIQSLFFCTFFLI